MRVLLVEDEGRMAQALCELLRQERYDVDCFAEGAEGLCPENSTLGCGQLSVRLSDKEYRILEYLISNRGQILTREQLALKIWGYDSEAEYNNVEVYMSFVRKKLNFVGSKAEIEALAALVLMFLLAYYLAKRIRYENERMSALISQLLELARTENVAPKAEALDLSRLACGEALPFESVAFEAGLSLCTQIEEGITLTGDADELRQLCSILLDNAIRHSPRGTGRHGLRRAEEEVPQGGVQAAHSPESGRGPGLAGGRASLPAPGPDRRGDRLFPGLLPPAGADGVPQQRTRGLLLGGRAGLPPDL